MSTTVCSQAQIDGLICAWLKNCTNLCPQESILRSSMSSPCWSLPHLLTHSLPQHEAPPGQHDLLQEHSTNLAQLLHHDLLQEPQAHPAQLQTSQGRKESQPTPHGKTNSLQAKKNSLQRDKTLSREKINSLERKKTSSKRKMSKLMKKLSRKKKSTISRKEKLFQVRKNVDVSRRTEHTLNKEKMTHSTRKKRNTIVSHEKESQHTHEKNCLSFRKKKTRPAQKERRDVRHLIVN